MELSDFLMWKMIVLAGIAFLARLFGFLNPPE